jgi:hypothetical protein
MRFASAVQFAREAFIGFVFDELDYLLTFGYRTELEALLYRYSPVFGSAAIVTTFSAREAQEHEEFRTKITTYGTATQTIIRGSGIVPGSSAAQNDEDSAEEEEGADQSARDALRL